MSFLVCSFPTLIPFPIDITTFLSSFKTKQNKTFHFGLFSKKKKKAKSKNKIPKAAPYTLKVLSQGCNVPPEREWMTEERNTRTYSRNVAGSFHRSSIGGGMGMFEIFLLFS